MDRITAKDLDRAFDRYCKTLFNCGVDTTKYRLQHGSRTMGVLYTVLAEGAAGVGARWGGEIGTTRKEAYETLETITRTVDDMRRARRKFNPDA